MISVDPLRRNQHFFHLRLGNGGSKMKKCRFPILQNHQKTLEINVFEQIKSLGTFAKLKSGSKTFSVFQKSAKNTQKLLKSALLRWGFKNNVCEKVDSTKVLCRHNSGFSESAGIALKIAPIERENSQLFKNIYFCYAPTSAKKVTTI